MKTVVCYCPHHEDGDEDCDGCLGCNVSAEAVKSERKMAFKKLAAVILSAGGTVLIDDGIVVKTDFDKLELWEWDAPLERGYKLAVRERRKI